MSTPERAALLRAAAAGAAAASLGCAVVALLLSGRAAAPAAVEGEETGEPGANGDESETRTPRRRPPGNDALALVEEQAAAAGKCPELPVPAGEQASAGKLQQEQQPAPLSKKERKKAARQLEQAASAAKQLEKAAAAAAAKQQHQKLPATSPAAPQSQLPSPGRPIPVPQFRPAVSSAPTAKSLLLPPPPPPPAADSQLAAPPPAAASALPNPASAAATSAPVLEDRPPFSWVVLWDFENARATGRVSGVRIVKRVVSLLRAARAGGARDAVEIIAMGNTAIPSLTDPLQMELQSSGVSLMHVASRKLESADKCLLVQYGLALRVPCPARRGIAFITGDSDFAYAVSVARNIGFLTAVFHPPANLTSPYLSHSADILLSWEHDVLAHARMLERRTVADVTSDSVSAQSQPSNAYLPVALPSEAESEAAPPAAPPAAPTSESVEREELPNEPLLDLAVCQPETAGGGSGLSVWSRFKSRLRPTSVPTFWLPAAGLYLPQRQYFAALVGLLFLLSVASALVRANFDVPWANDASVCAAAILLFLHIVAARWAIDAEVEGVEAAVSPGVPPVSPMNSKRNKGKKRVEKGRLPLVSTLRNPSDLR